MTSQFFIMADLAAYMGGWTALPIICLVLGVALMIIEMLTPGLGAPAVIGSVLLVAAVVLQAKTFADAMITLLSVIVILIAAAIIIFRSFNRGRLSKTDLTLDDVIDGKSTSISCADAQDYIGMKGTALAELRPVGFAEFNGKKLDVVSNGEFIKKGEAVVITAVEGLKITVEKVKD